MKEYDEEEEEEEEDNYEQSTSRERREEGKELQKLTLDQCKGGNFNRWRTIAIPISTARGSHFEWQLYEGQRWLNIGNDHVIETHYCQPGAKGMNIYPSHMGSVYSSRLVAISIIQAASQ